MNFFLVNFPPFTSVSHQSWSGHSGAVYNARRFSFLSTLHTKQIYYFLHFVFTTSAIISKKKIVKIEFHLSAEFFIMFAKPYIQ